MTFGVSFSCKKAWDGFVLWCFVLCFAAVKSSDDWITVKEVTPNPIFVTVNQTLKVRLDIHNLQVAKWDTNAFWVYAKNSSSHEYDLQWIRKIGSKNETYYSYNKKRVSRERQIDLIVSRMTLADSGIYRCKFRKPPSRTWSLLREYKVIVEEEKSNAPQKVYITRGHILNLQPHPPQAIWRSNDKNYEIFWDFSSLSKQEETSRIIKLMGDSVETLDTRASLNKNETALILTNTTLSDGGIYHLRIVKPLSFTTIHIDFNVTVLTIQDKPIASLDCPSKVRLTKGDNFFCLCKDISTSEVKAQATWLRDGQVFKHTRFFHENKLYLRNISTRDAGGYTCRVRFGSMVDQITLKVFVLPDELEAKASIPSSTKKHPDWYYVAGSLGVGVLLGIVLVCVIISIRRKFRRKSRCKSHDVYEDARTSPDLELDITAEYQDISSQTFQHQGANFIAPYEIIDLTDPVYMDMNQGKLKNGKANEVRCSHQNDVMPGYAYLKDYRSRVDSHPYQELQQYEIPGNRA